MRKSQKGFGAVEALLIIIIVGLIGFVGWYVWHARNNANSTYNSAASVTNNTKSGTATANNSSVIKIPELGIQITVPSSLKDLTYGAEDESSINPNATGTAATFSTAALAMIDSNCSAATHLNSLTGTDTGGPLGTIEKINGTPGNSYGSVLLKESGYFIVFQSSQSGCSQLQSAQLLQAQGKDALTAALGKLNAVKLIQ